MFCNLSASSITKNICAGALCTTIARRCAAALSAAGSRWGPLFCCYSLIFQPRNGCYETTLLSGISIGGGRAGPRGPGPRRGPAGAGTVVGAVDRLAIPGVNVLIKGTNRGTATNADGRCALPNVPESATLVFSFVGYKSVERPAVADNLDVAPSADANGLDEVMVTAYNIKQDKRTLVTAVQEEAPFRRPPPRSRPSPKPR